MQIIFLIITLVFLLAVLYLKEIPTIYKKYLTTGWFLYLLCEVCALILSRMIDPTIDHLFIVLKVLRTSLLLTGSIFILLALRNISTSENLDRASLKNIQLLKYIRNVFIFVGMTSFVAFALGYCGTSFREWLLRIDRIEIFINVAIVGTCASILVLSQKKSWAVWLASMGLGILALIQWATFTPFILNATITSQEEVGNIFDTFDKAGQSNLVLTYMTKITQESWFIYSLPILAIFSYLAIGFGTLFLPQTLALSGNNTNRKSRVVFVLLLLFMFVFSFGGLAMVFSLKKTGIAAGIGAIVGFLFWAASQNDYKKYEYTVTSDRETGKVIYTSPLRFIGSFTDGPGLGLAIITIVFCAIFGTVVQGIIILW